MNFTAPNIISIIRIIISPFFLYFLISEDSELVRISVFLFIFGAFTDWLDGWLARKYNVITSLGKFVDPLADKFLTTAAFLAFAILDIIPYWMVVIVAIRDFGTTFLRVYADNRNYQLHTSYSAKVKTTIQMLYIAVILVLIYLKNSTLSDLSAVELNSYIYSDISYYSMLGITLLTVWTAIEYINKNKLMFISKENSENV